MADLEQTHFVAGKVFVFQVPKLESSEGFKQASWPKTPIWTGQLRVVSKGDKVSVLLEHIDKGTATHSTQRTAQLWHQHAAVQCSAHRSMADRAVAVCALLWPSRGSVCGVSHPE